MIPQIFNLSPPEVAENHSMQVKSGVASSAQDIQDTQDQGASYSLIAAQVFLVLGALFVFILWFSMAIMKDKPLNSLDKVYINTELSPQELRTINLALTGSSSLVEMQENLQNIPWVRDVTLSRKLSGTTDILMLDLAKAAPLAKTRKGKLLFSDGKLIENQAADYDVPLISGVLVSGTGEQSGVKTNSERNKGERGNSRGYGQNSALGETINALSTLSSSYGLNIIEYKVSQAGALDVLLASGAVVKMGAKDHDKRLERLSRFLASYGDRVLSAKNIDLRHNKGLAVLWAS